MWLVWGTDGPVSPPTTLPWSCPSSAGSRGLISHTYNLGGPHQSPQTTRDTPKIKEHFLTWFLENTESSRHPFKLQQTIFNCILASLYKGLSVRPLVGSSVCLSVGLSICLKCMLSIGQNLTFGPFKLTEKEQKWLIMIHVHCTSKHRNNNDHHHCRENTILGIQMSSYIEDRTG